MSDGTAKPAYKIAAGFNTSAMLVRLEDIGPSPVSWDEMPSWRLADLPPLRWSLGTADSLIDFWWAWDEFPLIGGRRRVFTPKEQYNIARREARMRRRVLRGF